MEGEMLDGSQRYWPGLTTGSPQNILPCCSPVLIAKHLIQLQNGATVPSRRPLEHAAQDLQHCLMTRSNPRKVSLHRQVQLCIGGYWVSPCSLGRSAADALPSSAPSCRGSAAGHLP